MEKMERRKQKFVDPFQRKLAMRMIVYWLFFQFTLLNLLFCWRLLSEGSGNLAEQYGRFLGDYWPVIVCFLLIVPALAWDAVRFSHRFAGPIVRFRQIARDLAAGKPVRRVKLRNGDELLELQTDFNAMLDRLAEDHAITLISSAPTNPSAEANHFEEEDVAQELLTTGAE